MKIGEIAALIEGSPHQSVMGLIGNNPTTYSKSRIMWNATFFLFGIDAEYIPFDVENESLDAVLDLLASHEKIRGFNITNPHKVSVAEHFWDSVDTAAMGVGNVNTVHKHEGNIYAHSTDGYGAFCSIEDICGEGFLKGKKVVVIGAGGSGSAVAVECCLHGAEVYAANRTKIINRMIVNSAKNLAERALKQGMRINPVQLYEKGNILHTETQDAIMQADIVINTIPLEKENPKMPVLPRWAFEYSGKKVFMDIVYGNGHKSMFLEYASLHGHTAIPGEWMLLHQAVKAFEHAYADEAKEKGLTSSMITAPMKTAVDNLPYDAPQAEIEKMISLEFTS